MPLTMKILSKQRHILGADSIRVFSVHGGSIGRAPDNDWVLPDPDRYISGHHATVDYRSGAYYLKDTSTNGVFVNHSEQPVGRGTPIRLYDGDEIRLGDYILEVTIVNVSRDGTDDSGDAANGEEAPRRLKRRAPAGPLSLKLLGDEADQLQEAARNEALYGDTVRITEEEVEGHAREVDFLREAVGGDESGRATDDSMSIELHDEPSAGGAAAPFGGPSQSDLHAAVELLMECAGLDANRLPRGSDEETLRNVGRMIRATVDGLQGVMRSRALIKSQLRLSQTTIQAVGNNPLKFMPTVQDALEHLFYDHAEGYLGPVGAVEDALRDLRAHETAMVKAMQVAFRDLLDRLEPEYLEEKFQRSAKRGGLLSSSGKAKYWDLYRDTYQGVAGHSDENFANIVGGKFADAYDREMHRVTGRQPPPKDES